MRDSWMLRKLEPGLVEMYSRSSVFSTSTMKSEPGRSTTMSPGIFFSFFFGPSFTPSFAGASCFAASGDCASTVAAAAPALAAAPFRNVRRSTPAFLSSSIDFSSCMRRNSLAGKSIIGIPPERRSSMANKIMPLADAVARNVRDGQTVSMEGFTHLIPFAAGHEVIRQGRKDLRLVRMTPDIIYDQLIGMGCARGVVFSWGGNPGVGSIHRFRDAIENGWPHPLAIE